MANREDFRWPHARTSNWPLTPGHPLVQVRAAGDEELDVVEACARLIKRFGVAGLMGDQTQFQPAARFAQGDLADTCPSGRT